MLEASEAAVLGTRTAPVQPPNYLGGHTMAQSTKKGANAAQNTKAEKKLSPAAEALIAIDSARDDAGNGLTRESL